MNGGQDTTGDATALDLSSDAAGDKVTPCAESALSLNDIVAGQSGSSLDRTLPSRRTVVREGAKLAFVAPLMSTFLASQAYAANYSCYPAGHACTNLGTDPEPCCDGACPGNPSVCP